MCAVCCTYGRTGNTFYVSLSYWLSNPKYPHYGCYIATRRLNAHLLRDIELYILHRRHKLSIPLPLCPKGRAATNCLYVEEGRGRMGKSFRQLYSICANIENKILWTSTCWILGRYIIHRWPIENDISNNNNTNIHTHNHAVKGLSKAIIGFRERIYCNIWTENGPMIFRRRRHSLMQ